MDSAVESVGRVRTSMEWAATRLSLKLRPSRLPKSQKLKSRKNPNLRTQTRRTLKLTRFSRILKWLLVKFRNSAKVSSRT